MSLTLLSSTFTQICNLGRMCNLDFVGDYSYRFPLTVRVHDLLLPFIGSGIFHVPIGGDRVSRALGFRGNYPMENIVVSNKPETHNYPEFEKHDVKYYRNFSYNLQQFSNFLFGKSASIPDYSGEKFCRHYTYLGEMITKQTDLRTVIPGSFYSASMPVHYTSNLLWYTAKVLTSQPLTIQMLPTSSGFHNYSLDDVLDGIINAGSVSTSSFGFGLQIRTLSDLSYHKSKSLMLIRYHSRLQTLPVPENGFYNDDCHWDSEIEIPLGIPDPTVYPVDNGVYNTVQVPGCTFRYHDGHRTINDNEGPLSGSYTSPYSDYLCFLSDPSVVDLDEESRYEAISIQIGSGGSLHSFADAVHAEFDQIVPSSLFSTVAAFKQCETSLDVNILQNIAKLPDIAKAMPHIREAIDLAGRLLHRDFRLSTFREILDLLTATELQRSFEWRPYLDVLTKYLPDMAAFWSLFGRTSPRAIGRGSYRFKFPDKVFGRSDVTLITRTKLVMDTSNSALLSAILGTDAIGVIPKASNIWDLIPFTFVVNWFTGVGSALRRAEYSVLLMTIPAYYVHTYTISSPFTDAELAAWNLQNSSSKPSTLRLFYRDLSLYSPVPRDSRFGFGIPSELPPIGTLGSLLYQLLLK